MARYIDADELNNDLTAHKENDWNKELCLPLPDVVDDCIDIVDRQPTAEVKPVVRGEWMEDSEGEIYCSKCGKYTYDRHDEIVKFNGTTIIALCHPRYCGNCGADMRGDGE